MSIASDIINKQHLKIDWLLALLPNEKRMLFELGEAGKIKKVRWENGHLVANKPWYEEDFGVAVYPV